MLWRCVFLRSHRPDLSLPSSEGRRPEFATLGTATRPCSWLAKMEQSIPPPVAGIQTARVWPAPFPQAEKPKLLLNGNHRDHRDGLSRRGSGFNSSMPRLPPREPTLLPVVTVATAWIRLGSECYSHPSSPVSRTFAVLNQSCLWRRSQAWPTPATKTCVFREATLLPLSLAPAGFPADQGADAPFVMTKRNARGEPARNPSWGVRPESIPATVYITNAGVRPLARCRTVAISRVRPCEWPDLLLFKTWHSIPTGWAIPRVPAMTFVC